VRAVLEGVAFGLRDSLDLLRALGVDVTSARVSGGGARSELWLRICASVLGVPIERMVVEEGSAFGAALLGGVASGVFSDVEDAVSRTVRTLDTVEPEAGWIAAYAEHHARYTRLYPALRALDGATVER
jgi:xylulokinase